MLLLLATIIDFQPRPVSRTPLVSGPATVLKAATISIERCGFTNVRIEPSDMGFGRVDAVVVDTSSKTPARMACYQRLLGGPDGAVRPAPLRRP